MDTRDMTLYPDHESAKQAGVPDEHLASAIQLGHIEDGNCWMISRRMRCGQAIS